MENDVLDTCKDYVANIERMHNAACSLSEKLRVDIDDRSISVGIGDNCLYVYEHIKKDSRVVPETWDGYKVIVKFIGEVGNTWHYLNPETNDYS